MENAQAQLPQYQCHKKVWALKIKAIEPEKMPEFKAPTCRGSIALGSGCYRCERCSWERDHGAKLGFLIVPEEKAFAPIRVGFEYMSKHKPEVGGYWVKYDDGYQSFSPKEAFEGGYDRI